MIGMYNRIHYIAAVGDTNTIIVLFIGLSVRLYYNNSIVHRVKRTIIYRVREA